jgi:hypothetical protein
MESAQAFSRATPSVDAVPWPEKINVDGNSDTNRGLRLLATEGRRWPGLKVRAPRYLNSVVEQDHRAIARRGGCSRRASIRRSGGANCDVSRARRSRLVPRLPGAGFRPRKRFEICSKYSLMVTRIRGS